MTPPPPRGWRKLLARSLDWLYPPECALCAAPLTLGKSLCPACDANLPRLTAPFCQSCGEPFPGQIDHEFDCPNCGKLRFAFDFARPALCRDDQTLDLIHRLKYQRHIHLARELGRLAAEAFDDPRLAIALEQRWPLIPIPLFRKRLRHRHFNQAAEIARSLAEIFGLSVLDALRRTRSTETQTALGRKQRMKNLGGAFALTRQAHRWLATPHHGVILIDDVLTTGSTIHECARTLRQAGVAPIAAITVMRG